MSVSHSERTSRIDSLTQRLLRHAAHLSPSNFFWRWKLRERHGLMVPLLHRLSANIMPAQMWRLLLLPDTLLLTISARPFCWNRRINRANTRVKLLFISRCREKLSVWRLPFLPYFREASVKEIRVVSRGGCAEYDKSWRCFALQGNCTASLIITVC